MITWTSATAPAGLTELICAGTSFSDVSASLLPALTDDLEAESSSFRQVVREGGAVRLGHTFSHEVSPATHDRWRGQFRSLDPIAVAAPIPGGTGHAFALDEWLDFGAYLRSAAYEDFYGPLGIHHVLIARYAYSESETFLFGLHRAAGERRFSDADVARLGALLPVLGSTLSRMRLAEELTKLRERRAAIAPVLAELTRREREIAADVAEGLANKDIARRRRISVHTVENHLRAIFRKSGVDSRTKLALAAGADGPV
jgi:DNA-binding CsgD family transcriptional regulator